MFLIIVDSRYSFRNKTESRTKKLHAVRYSAETVTHIETKI